MFPVKATEQQEKCERAIMQQHMKQEIESNQYASDMLIDTHTHTFPLVQLPLYGYATPKRGGARSMLVAQNSFFYVGSCLYLYTAGHPHCTTTLLQLLHCTAPFCPLTGLCLSSIHSCPALISFSPEASSTVMHGCGDEVVATTP